MERPEGSWPQRAKLSPRAEAVSCRGSRAGAFQARTYLHDFHPVGQPVHGEA
jgi:hypothetical protein